MTCSQFVGQMWQINKEINMGCQRWIDCFFSVSLKKLKNMSVWKQQFIHYIRSLKKL